MKVLITGGTGLVGKNLINNLIANKCKVVLLTRNADKAQKQFSILNLEIYEWPNSNELPPIAAFHDLDGIINLMGENIGGKRWDDVQKKKLYESRVNATKNLVKQVNSLQNKPNFFISASAIGIYPVNLMETLDENSKIASNFLGNLCHEWEMALNDLPASTRKVILRTGVVLDKTDGALKKMLPPFKMGVGGIIGDGLQMMSWIDIDDLVSLYTKAALDSTFSGIYNACSPNPVTNFEFTKALGKALNRPTLFPVPKIAIKIMFGEMSTIILDGQNIISNKINPSFFKYPKIDDSLKKIFS